MTFSIEHSGKIWRPLGRGKVSYIWPIEELFARRHFGPTVQERIRKLTGGSLEEGSIIPGWHPKPQSWRRTKRLLQSGKRSFSKPYRGPNGRIYSAMEIPPHKLLAVLDGRLE